MTNFSSAPKTFRVVDWIGTPGWIPSTYSIPPGATKSISGWAIYIGSRANENSTRFSWNPFGAAVADVEDGLFVQTAVLTGSPRGDYGTVGDFARCSEWTGGWTYAVGGIFYPDGTEINTDGCNQGAGPVIDNGAGFFPAGTPILLPWLHTDSKRRVNISFINPEHVAADVTISVFPADGSSPVVTRVTVPEHTVSQINDIFATYFPAVRARNDVLKAAAARATIVSTTRLYPLAYVVSNQNNTVTLSLPR
ncbi:MAG: hypothetical protein PT977_15705 [Acidobacteriota bacterium]|nr:hypothetical protein [Acidobacteriota bacterium]